MEAEPRMSMLKLRCGDQPGRTGKLFEGHSFCLLGFKRLAPEQGNKSHSALQPAKSVVCIKGGLAPLRGLENASADCMAAQGIFKTLEYLITQEGGHILDVSTQSIRKAHFIICNFASGLAQMKDLLSLKQQIQGKSDRHVQPQHLLAALGVEPLRFLSPVWIFCCCRDRRVYAPQFHPLFEVSASLAESRPPLLRIVQQDSERRIQTRDRTGAEGASAEPDEECTPMRVLLLGCTNRLRRVTGRKSLSIWENLENDDTSSAYTETVAAGKALAINDRTLLHFCIEALGGRVASFGDVKAMLKSMFSAQHSSFGGNNSVDLVIVGDMHAVQRHGISNVIEFASPLVHELRKRSKKAEGLVLQKLQAIGIPCLRLQWLFDTYRLGRLPLQSAYEVHVQRSQPARVASLTAPALRRDQILRGVFLLLSDASAIRSPDLFELLKAKGNQGRHSQSQAGTHIVIAVNPEEAGSILDLAGLIKESVEAAAEDPLLDEDVGIKSRTRSRQKHGKVLARLEEPHSLQKLVESARQRFLAHLSKDEVNQVMRSWDKAVSACSVAWGAPDNSSALEEQRAAKGGTYRASVVSCEWLLRCWSEARYAPLETIIGREIYSDEGGGPSPSLEDPHFQTILEDCDGAVVYGEFTNNLNEFDSRFRRAVDAVESMLHVASEVERRRAGISSE